MFAIKKKVRELCIKLKILCFGTLLIYIYIILNINYWKDNRSLHWDKSGYYAFLPATFIYHDLDRMDFITPMNEKYHFVPGVDYYGLVEQSNGKRLERYHLGVSLFQLPFFAIAHLVTVSTEVYPADGYSPYYMLAVCISSAFWAVLGLYILGAFLRRYFNDYSTVFAVLLLAFGTNLYAYSTFETGMSHPYSFFLIACVLNFTDMWYKTGRKKWVVLLGLTFGLIFIVRPVNIICLLLPLLWQTDTQRLKNRLAFFLEQKANIIIAIVVGIAVCAVQFAYWKYVTGDWLVYAYKDEHFNFADPRIWDGLFSYRKGWFIYTPIALVAFLGFFLNRYTRLLPALLLTIAVAIYVTFSWEQWYYGGSFGCRPLIDFLAVMAFPLASVIQYLSERRKMLSVASSILLFAFIFLSLWQTFQFKKGVIPWDKTTRAYYWKVFFDIKPNPEYQKLLDK